MLDKPIEATSTKLQEAAATAPIWGPSAEMQKALSNQWAQVGGYKLQIPTGHFAKIEDLRPDGKAGNTVTDRFEASIWPNGSEGITRLRIEVHKRMKNGDQYFTVDQFTNNERYFLENDYRNAKLSDTELGKVGGVVFSRFTFSGAIESGHPIKGVYYAGYDGDWEITLHLEVFSTDDSNLFAFDAAALSFQRQ